MDASTASLPTNIGEYADSRARARSPDRARTARKKYASAHYFEPIRPWSHRSGESLDLFPRFDPTTGNRRQVSSAMFPDEAPVVKPTKRDLFEEAKWQKVPQRCGYDKRAFAREATRDRNANIRLGMSGDFEFKGQGIGKKGKRKGNRRVGWTEGEMTAAGAVQAAVWNEDYVCREDGCYGCMVSDRVDMGLNGIDDEGRVDLLDVVLREEDTRAWKEMEEHTTANKDDADALMDRATMKYETLNRARTKKLEKEGWDYVEKDMVLSPEPAWVDMVEGDEWEKDGFELL
ncbi:hypothetical protein NA57DRAFT_77133 [Rhizodiscina lignyota]|uniref:Uncharacterized protein n=1 Tax=Rhizodiscina lignyota TaxID=1504668 RepID=A0A9P4IE43_9PEZI|nr:hypothetical protein NA57DRAFT_77133 [Rhizodiscina lignyota]